MASFSPRAVELMAKRDANKITLEELRELSAILKTAISKTRTMRELSATPAKVHELTMITTKTNVLYKIDGNLVYRVVWEHLRDHGTPAPDGTEQNKDTAGNITLTLWRTSV